MARYSETSTYVTESYCTTDGDHDKSMLTLWYTRIVIEKPLLLHEFYAIEYLFVVNMINNIQSIHWNELVEKYYHKSKS